MEKVADDADATTYQYVYDAAGRLIEEKVNGATARTYTYDANGNRLTGPVAPPGPMTTRTDCFSMAIRPIPIPPMVSSDGEDWQPDDSLQLRRNG